MKFYKSLSCLFRNPYFFHNISGKSEFVAPEDISDIGAGDIENDDAIVEASANKINAEYNRKIDIV